MKLSFKFFCLAYIIVLLSTGLGGIFIVKNVTDTLWNTRIEQVNFAAKYAADSFLEFADVSYGEMSESKINDITRQIKNTLNVSVNEVEIYTTATAQSDFASLRDGEGVSRFLNNGGNTVMESVCCISTSNENYFLAVRSDFTETQNQCKAFWQGYAVVVLAISAISGLLLFELAKSVTKPLNQLTKATDEIALGNFGKTVNIKSSDYEISNLSKSFNSMSCAIEEKIEEIQCETQKRDIFVADFTHELKTPMTAIMGYAQMLNSYELNPDERKEASASIYSEAKRLENLSRQLLDLYVFQNEKTELENINLLTIARQLESTLKILSQKYSASYEIDLTDSVVEANSTLLLSLLYNLADNAFKSVSSDGNVKIYSIKGKDCVNVFVEDNGRGIAKENIEMITEPFYREDKSRSRRFGGAGLGLSLCKEIATLHGTQLHFESEKGKGTTVSFLLKRGGVYGE